MNTPISPELLRGFDVPGSRYNSYPTAERFVDAPDAIDDTGIQVTAQGCFFVRAMAMQFDRYSQAAAIAPTIRGSSRK